MHVEVAVKLLILTSLKLRWEPNILICHYHMLNPITSSVLVGSSFGDELPRTEGFREKAEQVRAEAGFCSHSYHGYHSLSILFDSTLKMFSVFSTNI